MRKLIFASLAASVVSALLLAPSAHAFASSDVIPDDAALAQLDQRAEHADPRERCFLYTELAHFYTMAAGRQLALGDTIHASASLKRIQYYASQIQNGLTGNVRKFKNLKNAEMLMHETTFHLGEYLHSVSSDDKPQLQAALKQLDHINDELLTQVFAH